MLLAPAMNIRRTPLGGRNWEYFSEDPLLTGVLATAYVRGVQSEGVGASAKHFAGNNQETERMRASSDIDERTLREIYLRGFQRVVRDAKPWTVMTAYNQVNGVYASQNEFLLAKVLRGEWGYDGVVVSDWGATHDRVAAVGAGLDLEMPSSHGRTDAEVVAAVQDGRLDERAVDEAARRVIQLALHGQESHARLGRHPVDFEAHDRLAREVAARSIVLLRNEPVGDEGPVLPLKPGVTVAVIGELAAKPRTQGAGSSFVNAIKEDNALDQIAAQVGIDNVGYAVGYCLEGQTEPAALQEAVELAASKEVAVVFLGLPGADDAEGVDRHHLNLPDEQLQLLDAVVAANPRTIAVITNGGVVTIPFATKVPAILEAWLLGQAGGAGTRDVLFGAVNPSARLSVTIPVRIEDDPSYLSTVKLSRVAYSEGTFVGYRGFDARKLEVAFPFGHGLSYSSFDYRDLTITAGETGLHVTVTVTNSSSRDGREVVQLYIGLDNSRVARPPRELKDFASVQLGAGERRTITLEVTRDDLAYWDTRVDRWVVEGGDYRVEVGSSSRDIRLRETVAFVGDNLELAVTYSTSMSELIDHPVAGPVLARMMAGGRPRDKEGGVVPDIDHVKKVSDGIPIDNLMVFAGVPKEQLDGLIALANGSQ